MTDSELIAAIKNIIWPGGDPDAEWEPETIEDVANLLINEGRGPDGTPSSDEDEDP
jgi:hypothetical protein